MYVHAERLLVLANVITLGRLALSASLVGIYLLAGRGGAAIMSWLVCAIWASDVADGRIARLGWRWGAAPRRDGQALDPLVDDFAYAAGFMVLMSLGVLPLWFLALVVLSRSLFAIVRMVGLAMDRPFARPRRSTKAKGVVLATGQVTLFQLVLHHGGASPTQGVVRAMLLVMTVACLVALGDFAVRTNGQIFLQLLRRR